jgi:tetratricopeptide (TPR) repeat protein
LTLLVLLVFAQVGNFDFVNLDDDIYVYDNPHVHTGLTAENVVWAFGVHGPAQWHPLAYISHQLVYETLGANARPHHFANLAFHLASVLLLFLALRKMTGRLWPSALVAAMFGLHPLNVEPVAWICERRDVMCALFWMLTLWVYAGYARRGGALRYTSVALCCALALMSKPMAVTLPFALLLLDLWPLRRTSLGTCSPKDPLAQDLPACPPRSLSFLVWEKLPLLGLAVIASVLSILSHRSAVIAFDTVPLHVRVANGLVAYAVYLRKMIWPRDLCAWYPHPASQPSFQLSSLIWAALAAAVLLLAITALAVYQARRRPYLAVGWFWYLGVLFPVIGLFQTGSHAYADRFTYLPLIGIYMAIAWGTAERIARWPRGQLIVKTATPVLLVACMIASSAQTATWRDSRSLYKQALRHTKENALVHNNLGNALQELGLAQEAIKHHRESLRIKPDFAEAHSSLGNALQSLGSTQEALDHYQQALRIRPDLPETYNGMGLAVNELGRPREAIAHFQQALRIKPEYAEAYYNLGIVLHGAGHFEEAIALYQKALQFKPRYPEAHNNWGAALSGLGRPQEAAWHYEQALRIKPDHAEAYNNLGVVLADQGRHQEAISHYQQALRINSEYADAYNNLGLAYSNIGRLAEALRHFEQALRLKPDYTAARENLRKARARLQEDNPKLE